MSFIKLTRSLAALELAAQDPNATAILMYGALRANRSTGLASIRFTDFPGMTRQQYRSALKRIAKNPTIKVTTRTTNKGTVLSYENSALWDIGEADATIKTTTTPTNLYKNDKKNLSQWTPDSQTLTTMKMHGISWTQQMLDEFRIHIVDLESNGRPVNPNSQWLQWCKREPLFAARDAAAAKPKANGTRRSGMSKVGMSDKELLNACSELGIGTHGKTRDELESALRSQA